MHQVKHTTPHLTQPNNCSVKELLSRIEFEQSMLCPSSANADADELKKLMLADLILDVCKTMVSAAHHRDGGFGALAKNTATVFLASTESRSTLSSEDMRKLLGGNAFMLSRHVATIGINAEALCVLLDHGVSTIGQLVTFTREQLKPLRGLGEAELDHIEVALAGVCLGLSRASGEQGAERTVSNRVIRGGSEEIIDTTLAV